MVADLIISPAIVTSSKVLLHDQGREIYTFFNNRLIVNVPFLVVLTYNVFLDSQSKPAYDFLKKTGKFHHRAIKPFVTCAKTITLKNGCVQKIFHSKDTEMKRR